MRLGKKPRGAEGPDASDNVPKGSGEKDAYKRDQIQTAGKERKGQQVGHENANGEAATYVPKARTGSGVKQRAKNIPWAEAQRARVKAFTRRGNPASGKHRERNMKDEKPDRARKTTLQKTSKKGLEHPQAPN